MPLPYHLPLWILALVAVYLLPTAAKAYKRHRQMLWLRCPDAEVDVLVQLRRAPADGEPILIGPCRGPVTDCSAWPERRGCSQRCARGG